jgi:hypothetical protein
MSMHRVDRMPERNDVVYRWALLVMLNVCQQRFASAQLARVVISFGHFL